MANPNPGPLSKWLFIITMVGAVAYIGAAFSFVIMADSDGAAIEKKTAAVSANKGETKKPMPKTTNKNDGKPAPKGGTP